LTIQLIIIILHKHCRINIYGGSMIKHCVIALVTLSLLYPVACKKSTITPKLFVTIQNEMLVSDMQPATKESIVAKYNLSLKEYEEYEKKVESDPQLKAEVGKERLNCMKQ